MTFHPTFADQIVASSNTNPWVRLSNLGSLDSLQVLRASLAQIPPKHKEEVESLTRSYKDQYRNWLFELRSLPKRAVLMQPWDWFDQFYCSIGVKE